MRLDFLSHLEKMTDHVLTPEIIALVELIDKKGFELFEEATKLGTGSNVVSGRRQPDAFDVLYKKFDVFASLNPSLQLAYDEACRPLAKAAS